MNTISAGQITKPSMEPSGVEAFTQYLRGVSVYMEFGSGGSTLLAARSGVKEIISVDSHPKWAASIRRQTLASGANVHIAHCDIGPVGEWGMPTAWTGFRNFFRYPTLPWEIADDRKLVPQLILVDGRFRVACFLFSLLNARVGTPVLFDDYRDRPEYHIVEQYCGVREMRGRMAVFVVEHNYATKSIAQELMRYSVDPN